MLNTDNPAAFYPDASGGPLQGGLVYFGLPGQNPVTSPVTVYWDSAGTQPAAQPVKIFNGHTVRQDGTPSRVWVVGDYSKLVQDPSGRQIAYETNQPLPPTVQLSVTDRFSGTGAPATFALAATPADGTSLDVYVGGVYQQKNSYTVVGNQLTITATAGVNNVEAITRNTLNYANVAQLMATQVTTAQTAAGAASTSRAAIDNRIYPGTYATPPTTRPDSSAVQNGDEYSGADGTRNARVLGVWVDRTSEALASSNAAASSEVAAATYAANVAIMAQVTGLYPTAAAMNAAIGTIAANAYVSVLVDENNQGQSSIYRKTGGVMVYQQYLAYPRKFSAGAAWQRSYPRNSVHVTIGDSMSVKGGEWGVGYINGWQAVGGIFEGWTFYNLASNGSPASVWAGQIAAGNQSEAPQDYSNNLGYNPWAAVNADPDEILFRLGTNDLRMDGSAGAISTLRGNLAALITFLLAHTRAHITMKVPPPIAYANPDPGGFTNCVDANDAAARSAALRTLYLEYANVTERITVVDMQKHLYGFREDSIGAAQDPEGQGALKKDSLHPTNLGATREAQIISRIYDPARPYTSAVAAVPIQAAYKDALISTLVNVKASGSGFVDIYVDSISQFLGSLTRGYPRGPLSNIRRAELLTQAGAQSLFREILQGTQFILYYPATGGTATISSFTASYVAVDGINDYWHITATGTFAGTGAAIAYVTDPQRLPKRVPDAMSMQINMAGALPLTSGACTGAACLALSDTKPTFNATSVSGVRQAATGVATIDLYVANVWNKSYSGSVSAGAPGYKLGTLSFADGFFESPTWAADATNFPGGAASLPDAPSNLTVINAVLSSGSLGNYGSVSIRAR